MKEWININGSTKTCGQCAYKAYLGENSQGQQVYGCKRKGRCKENRAGESKELELSDFITESQI